MHIHLLITFPIKHGWYFQNELNLYASITSHDTIFFNTANVNHWSRSSTTYLDKRWRHTACLPWPIRGVVCLFTRPCGGLKTYQSSIPVASQNWWELIPKRNNKFPLISTADRYGHFQGELWTHTLFTHISIWPPSLKVRHTTPRIGQGRQSVCLHQLSR